MYTSGMATAAAMKPSSTAVDASGVRAAAMHAAAVKSAATVVRALSASSFPRSLETECTPILQPRHMYLSFAAKKMKAHTESHSLDAYTTRPLSRTTRAMSRPSSRGPPPDLMIPNPTTAPFCRLLSIGRSLLLLQHHAV
jgi:hypothetical protein